jgi:hypothetical protein
MIEAMGRLLGFWLLGAGILQIAGCGGETVGRLANHDTPPGGSGGGRTDGGGQTADAAADGAVLDPDALTPLSGSRLTIVEPFYLGGPTLWDEQKNVACSPALASDGTERCIPTSIASVDFSDSSCMHAVIASARNSCGRTYDYYVDNGGGGQCPLGKTTVYTMGARIDTPAEVFPHNSYPCALLDRGTSPPPGTAYYDAVPSDPSDWTLLTVEIVPATDALSVVVWKGADGSRLPYGFRLRRTDTPCDRYPNTADTTLAVHCIPSVHARPGDGFPNDQCSGQPLFGSCGPTEVAEMPGPDFSLFKTDKKISPVYFKNPLNAAECVTLPAAWTSAPNPSVFYTVGASLDQASYPRLDVKRQGSERIQIDYITSAGKNLFAESYYDTKYDLRCNPIQLSDGGRWCVPGALEFTPDYPGYFSDPQCTHAVDINMPQALLPGEAPEPVLFGLVYSPGHSCDAHSKPTLYSLEKYSGPLFQYQPDGCPPAETPSPGAVLYVAKDPIDPSGAVGELPR